MATAPNLSEFALIERYFRPLSHPSEFVQCGIGDDCAVLSVPAGEELLISVDTLVEGVHFPVGYAPDLLARRALAVCVSDLAASGAEPQAFTLALCLPELNESWLSRFSAALAEDAGRYGAVLVGGDTTRGPLCITLQVMGTAPRGKALLRSGAQPGDRIYVSGTLGDARAALDFLDSSAPSAAQDFCLQRYHTPEPRLALGAALRGVASAALDVSDGLAADLGHILAASGVGARLDAARLPLSPALRELYPLDSAKIDSVPVAWRYALSGGDDYELCFTAPVDQRKTVAALAESLSIAISEIGEIESDEGLRCADAGGAAVVLAPGYQHF